MNNLTDILINITSNFNYTIINSYPNNLYPNNTYPNNNYTIKDLDIQGDLYPIDNFNYTIKDLDIQGELYHIDNINIKLYVNNTSYINTINNLMKKIYILFYIILLYLILLYLINFLINVLL